MKIEHFNETLETLFLDGCKVIKTGCRNRDGKVSQILFECPKDYKLDEKRGYCKHLTVEFNDLIKHWYIATYYYADKRYAVNEFIKELRENQKMTLLINQNQ